jgi:hypothetical protein
MTTRGDPGRPARRRANPWGYPTDSMDGWPCGAPRWPASGVYLPGLAGARPPPTKRGAMTDLEPRGRAVTLRRPPGRCSTTVRSGRAYTFDVFVRTIGTWWPAQPFSAGRDRVQAPRGPTPRPAGRPVQAQPGATLNWPASPQLGFLGRIWVQSSRPGSAVARSEDKIVPWPSVRVVHWSR